MNKEDKKTFYITYNGIINTENINMLLKCIQEKVENGFNNFHLFVSSEGGEIPAALTAYNHITSIKNIDMTTYNIGKVASAANILFLVGIKRFALTHSYFLFHETRIFISNEMILKREEAKSFVLNAQNDERIMLAILSEKLCCKVEEIQWLFSRENIIGHDEDIFNQTPLKLNIIHEIIQSIPFSSSEPHFILPLK